MKYENELNGEQLDVVMNAGGTALVIAGPGSGKTRTLVYRVCHLIKNGENPQSILLLTFTNKAAREMKRRVEEKIGAPASQITAGTFHHFANTILRKNSEAFGRKSNFTILDTEDCKAILKKIIANEYGTIKKGVVESTLNIISNSKLRLEPISTLINGSEYWQYKGHEEEIERFALEYEKVKRSMNAVDFDDLLCFTKKLLEEHKNLRESYQERYTNILVDEFQDTDRVQAKLIALLHRKGNGLLVVGDDSQSIYSFRGADIRNILEFQKAFEARIFYLVKNYRSVSPIVKLINVCIEKSKQKIDKKLESLNIDGEKPLLLEANDKNHEAYVVGHAIEEELKTGNSIGVLFRAAYFASELEVYLSSRRITYDMRGGVKFFEQKHIKDLVCLLRVYHNPKDHVALLRLLMMFPKVGEKLADRIASKIVARESQKPEDVAIELSKNDTSGKFSSVLSKSFAVKTNAAGILDKFYETFYKNYMKESFENYEERIEDVEALISAAAKFSTVGQFLESFSLSGEKEETEADHKLVLSTIHQAKGLEWDTVFIIGIAEGMLPFTRADNIEEERRLFYVAASRARKRLIMSYPRVSGRFYGEQEENQPSRFIKELPKETYMLMGTDSNESKDEKGEE